jgi:hypothetical protein
VLGDQFRPSSRDIVRASPNRARETIDILRGDIRMRALREFAAWCRQQSSPD